jgi:hypothetical protein
MQGEGAIVEVRRPTSTAEDRSVSVSDKPVSCHVLPSVYSRILPIKFVFLLDHHSQGLRRQPRLYLFF